MSWFFKKNNTSGVAIGSTLELLQRKLGQRKFEVLLMTVNDRRLVFDQGARVLNKTAEELMRDFAKKLGLSFIDKVGPMDCNILNEKLSFSALRQAGAIATSVNGVLTGFICVDPKLLREELGDLVGTMGIYLSSWALIARALDESERHYLLRRSQGELRQSAEKALPLVLSEAYSRGAETVAINFRDGSPVYSFYTAEGRFAQGNISAKIRDSLQDILYEGSRRGAMIITMPSGRDLQVTIKIREPGAEVILSWKRSAAISDAALSDVDDLEEAPARAEGRVVNFPKNAARDQHDGHRDLDGHVGAGHSGRARGSAAQRGEGGNQQNRILVIDDDATFAKVLERFFSRHEIIANHVNSPEEAFRILDSGEVRIDLIVCDVHMPGLSGFEFLKRIRAVPRLQDVAIVMLTSDEDIETELRLLGDGADAFVAKTEDPRLLCVQVKRLLLKKNRREAA